MSEVDTSAKAVKRWTVVRNNSGLGYSDGIAPDKYGGFVDYEAYRTLAAERDALQARIVELETALRPFVDYVHDDLRKGDKKFTLTPWHHGGGGWICTLDLCRASNALIDKEPT